MGIVIGGGAPKRLPDTYKEVEYIESSGTQYINTGRTPSSEYCKVEANVTPYRPASSSYCAIFGMHTSGDDRFALKTDYSNEWRVDLGEAPLTWTDMAVSPGSNVDIRMVGDNRNTELVIGGVTCTMFSGYYPTIVQSTRPMYIFAYNEDGTTTSFISMKLYSFKIYSSSSTLARDFVPCYRVSDSVIGLYDLVNDVFYTNAGTGTFTKGNDVQTAIDILDIRYGRGNDYTPLMGPSPTGFHVPTKDEWQGLKNIMRGLSLDTGNQWKIKLHIPFAGRRKYDGTRQNQGTYGTYWSSSPYLYSSTSHSYYLYLTSSGSDASSNHNGRAYGRSVRCFKDTYATPDSSWTVVEGTLGNAGIFRDQTNGLISVTDGSNGYTIMDKNLGATTVYNDGDTLSEANCGKYYQWGNNYGFSRTGSITTSSTQVDASGYGPGNYYSDSTYIINSSNPYDWSSVRNDNLWGYMDYSKPPEVKKVMMRPNNVETQVRPVNNSWEFSYDFRGGSLAGFQTAGGKDIYTNGAYSFYNDGLGQTSSSNDRRTAPIVELPNITDAKKLTVSMTGNFIADSWSNNKGCGFGDGLSEWAYSSLRWTGEMSYNTSSASYYDRAGLCIVDGGTQTRKYLAGQFSFNSGDIELTITIDLESGLCTYDTTGANVISGTYTMSSAEISQFKSKVIYGCASRGRGYSRYNSERLYTMYIKIDY